MKRFCAFFFLSVILSAAIHPIVAMHFCGDKMKSLHIFQHQNHNNCCATVNLNSETQCIDANASKESDGEQQFNSYCCNLQISQLSTDDFQNPQQLQTGHVSLPSAQLLFLSAFTNALLTDDAVQFQNLKNDFPPDGLFYAEVDIRNYICIYRI